jgi:hypothetical protein
LQAIIEGATGTKWSEDKWEQIVPDFDIEVAENDASLIEELEEFIESDEPNENDFVVDQPILDGIKLARVPDVTHVNQSQVAEVLAAAGRTTEDPKSLSKEETALICNGVAAKVRESQAVTASGLEKVSISLTRLCFERPLMYTTSIFKRLLIWTSSAGLWQSD